MNEHTRAHDAAAQHASEAERVRALEDYTGRCYACLQADAPNCRHIRERRQDERLERTHISTGLADLINTWSILGSMKEAGTPGTEASPIEVRLLSAFNRAGLEPVCQYRIGRYITDFAFPQARLVVEADGNEYHQDAAREIQRDDYIRARGWHIIHFTGSDIWTDADALVRQVYRLARSSLT